MKQRFKYLIKSCVLLPLCCSVILTGCSGEDGMDGADGPQGEQGLPGPVGETGVGTVIYSDWFPTQFPDPLPVGTSSFTVNAPSLSQRMIDEGIVLVFAKLETESDGTFALWQLPFELDSGFVVREYQFSMALNELTISVNRPAPGTASFLLAEEYRYVLIPGGTENSGKGANKDLNTMTYEEVAAYFDIQD
ncbi:collagen-like protein [Croceitalea marina]|uniref:Collagen-like protein n=1 Tax=Croceitalea marina TaxID=1775166 RepID=A0ABW5MUF8_9FLAO